MSRGRKPKSQDNVSNWQQIFNMNVGRYLQNIIIELSKFKNNQAENKTGLDLLKKIKAEKEQLIKEKKLKKEKELPPIKATEIPFEISENWVWCRLGEIGICQTGTTPPTNIKKYFGNDIPFIKPADITLKGLIYDNEGLSFEGLKEGVLIPANSLMMVCIGGSIGKSYYTNIDVSCNQQINTITPLGGLNAQFLQFFLQSEYFQKAIWAKASGGTTPIVNRSKWESIFFALPPLSEQEKILNFLNDFENENLKTDGYYFNPEVEQKVIALHKSQLTGAEISSELSLQGSLLKSLRQQLLQDAVQGKLVSQDETEGNAQDLLAQIKAEKAQLIKDKKLKKEKDLPPITAAEIPFDIPNNWIWCRGEVIANYIDPQPSHRTPPESSDGIPYIAMSDIRKDGSIDFNFARKVSYTTLIEHQNRYKLQYGDFIFGKIGTIGKPIKLISPFNYTLSANVILIQPKREIINPNYLYYFLCSPVAEKNLIENKSTMSYPVFGIGKARNMIIPLPPLSEQNRIVQKLQALMQTCDALEVSIKQSATENEQLLQQVLREALQAR